MPRYFTYYWINEVCDPASRGERQGQPLQHIAGSRFLQRGVQPGDFVYVVTVRKGELFLIGRMKVGEICDTEEAARLLERPSSQLWNAPEHLIACAATSIDLECAVPLDLTQRLRFSSSQGAKPLKFKFPGCLDTQTLRSVRELMPASAQALDCLLKEKATF